MSNSEGYIGDVGEPSRPHLTISAHVVVQLGEELVTDVEQAILELAKNSYDADSEDCRISIEPDWTIVPEDPHYGLLAPTQDISGDPQPLRVGRVVISDSGVGIAQEGIESGWLRISASQKRALAGEKKEKTKKLRTPVGDKGLGRLATMKLGRVLRLRTGRVGESVWRVVAFSWDDFTPDRTLEDVAVYLEEEEGKDPACSGTSVEVVGLRDENGWTSPEYIERHLVPNLSSLVNPFEIEDKFEISIKSRGHSYELQSLSEQVLNLASAKFDFTWTGKELELNAYFGPSLSRGSKGDAGSARYAELFHEENKKKFIDWLSGDKKLKARGITFDVPAPWFCKLVDVVPGDPFPSDKAFPGATDPGPFSADAYYFLFNQATKDRLTQANVSAAMLQAMSQIAIYRDGFRVRANRDWLRLADGVTSGSSYYGLRPNNVIGYFKVSNENNARLIEKSDREGFVDNEALRGFMTLGMRSRDFANSSLEAIRISANKFVNQVPRDQSTIGRGQLVHVIKAAERSAKGKLAQISKEIAMAQGEIAERNSDASSVADTQDSAVKLIADRLKDLKSAVAAVDESVAEQARIAEIVANLSGEDRDYAARLLDAAAVGLAARSLAHELHHFVRQFRGGLERIVSENKSLKNSTISSASRVLDSAIREFGKLISTIDPMLPGMRSVREEIDVVEFVKDYFSARWPVCEKAGVDLRLNIPPDFKGLRVRFSRARLLQVVDNLFQNSLYWIKNGPLPMKDVRQIEVRITSRGFVWSDSGPGIRPSLEPSIFDPYVSDKATSEGMGLGLHIASTFLEMERSSIRVAGEKNALGRRSAFEVDLSGAIRMQRELI